jgi:hypothetical protein
MIRIENKRTFKGIGLYIGRPSLLGNPFEMKDKNNMNERMMVIDKYRDHLREIYRKEEKVRGLLMDLARKHQAGEEIVLVCWCAPLPCHGDVVKEAVEKIASSLT